MSIGSVLVKIASLNLDESAPIAYGRLIQNYNDILSAKYHQGEIEDLIYSECDALDGHEVDEDTAPWDDIREIQSDLAIEAEEILASV